MNKQIIQEDYAFIAKNKCGCKKSKLGYSIEQINQMPEANLGLGCGNPLAFSNIKSKDIVLDLGSGAGFDAFIAARKAKKVIGIDMTKEMVDKANSLANKHNIKNTEFIQAEIEDLPIKDNSIDIIISNCVINLSQDKLKVFQEAYRVLTDDGEMYISDIVLLQDLTEEQKQTRKLISGCVAGAEQKEDYLKIIEKSGFKYEILDEDKKIEKEQYKGISLESLKVKLIKN